MTHSHCLRLVRSNPCVVVHKGCSSIRVTLTTRQQGWIRRRRRQMHCWIRHLLNKNVFSLMSSPWPDDGYKYSSFCVCLGCSLMIHSHTGQRRTFHNKIVCSFICIQLRYASKEVFCHARFNVCSHKNELVLPTSGYSRSPEKCPPVYVPGC